MNRFYLSDPVSGNTATITDAAQLHHMRDVLRLKAGDEITVFDNLGTEHGGTITAINRVHAEIDIRSNKPAGPQKLKIAIAGSIPKKGKIDDIIDKLTQLGVDVIIPLETERGIVKLEEDGNARLERWRKIALNAAEQSQRRTLPVISPILSLKQVLESARDYDLKLIPTLTGATRPIKEVLTGVKPSAILALIGPEGDFSPGEVERAIEAGFIPVSLGETVLRVETAVIAVASFLRLEFMEKNR
jgi:16S rRNA (uracil1498-N3)-methyltransferase